MKTTNTYLYSYYKKDVHKFLEHLDKVKNKPDTKSIHQLRVDIKKLRAFIHLSELLFHDKFSSSDYTKIIEPVFKAATPVEPIEVLVKPVVAPAPPVLDK